MNKRGKKPSTGRASKKRVPKRGSGKAAHSDRMMGGSQLVKKRQRGAA